jgi:hypothetical protein
MDEDGVDVPAIINKLSLSEQFVDFVAFMTNNANELKQRLARKHEDQAEVLRLAGGEEVEKLWSGPAIPECISEYKRLAHLILSIPFGSVENERRFSAMNLAFTDLRNRLQQGHLNTSLRIASTSFVIEDFDFRAAFMEWKNPKERRGVDL